jgi:hypothetical protein
LTTKQGSDTNTRFFGFERAGKEAMEKKIRSSNELFSGAVCEAIPQRHVPVDAGFLGLYCRHAAQADKGVVLGGPRMTLPKKVTIDAPEKGV